MRYFVLDHAQDTLDLCLTLCAVRFTACFPLQTLTSVRWAATAAAPARTVRTSWARTAACCAVGAASAEPLRASAAKVWTRLRGQKLDAVSHMIESNFLKAASPTTVSVNFRY